MKVAINGAGIAGPALAFWLERTGHTPVLIEKAPGLRKGGYVIDFWGLGYDVAERMGLRDDVHAAGYNLQELRLVNRHGARVGGFPSSVLHELTSGRYTSLARSDLSALIHEALTDKVETVFGNSISALEQHEDGVRVSLEQGADRDFDLVIGADGLHSKIRELAFGPQGAFEKDLGYRVGAFEATRYRPRDELIYVSYSRPGRQVARFSMRDDKTLFLFVYRTDLAELAALDPGAPPREEIEAVFAGAGWECDASLTAMRGADSHYADRVSQIRMEKWCEGRVALIGDAAACVSLLAGEGTGLAMTEAFVLAGELQAAGGNHVKAFAEYQRRLQPFLRQKQSSAVAFAKSFAPRTALGIALRNLSTRLFTIPFFAHLMLGRTLRDDISLPDYALPDLAPPTKGTV